MTVLLAKILAALHLEDDDLVTLYERLDDLCHYLCTLYGRCTYLHGSLVVQEQNLVKLNSLALFCITQWLMKSFLPASALNCWPLISTIAYIYFNLCNTVLTAWRPRFGGTYSSHNGIIGRKGTAFCRLTIC